MKKIALIAATILGSVTAFSQGFTRVGSFTMGAQYTHEFVLDGYVRVREWELEGDKMPLKDLGMKSHSAVQLNMEKNLKRDRSISLVYDRYFIHGRSTFDRNITYNGTIINGRKGIDVSPTRYFRISAIYTAPLLRRPNFDLKYTAGVVVDHITFYLDGAVDPSSEKNEVFEGFGRQAFPYPVIGLKGSHALSANNKINWETSGTYVPKFKSFYNEGGPVHLQYCNLQSGINYTRTISDFEISVGTKLRYMYLFQDSKEDTNVIKTVTMGPFIGVVYHF
jgi:hypothetical protein